MIIFLFISIINNTKKVSSFEKGNMCNASSYKDASPLNDDSVVSCDAKETWKVGLGIITSETIDAW